MLWTAAALLTVALALLAISVRGRVTARGRFCRACAFDLAGIDAVTCPECGGDVTGADATRSFRRTRSRRGIVASVALMVIAGLIGALPHTGGPAFFAKLPDAQLLLLNRMGVDGALTELAARTTRAEPLSDTHWRVALERALAHQADTATPWDPRWGQVLAHAFVQQRMTEDQMRTYLRNGFDAEVAIRDRIAHDADRVGYWITWTQGRISTSGPPVTTGMWYAQQLSRVGVVGDNTAEQELHRSSGDLTIAGPGMGGSSGMGSSIVLPRDRPGGEPLRVYIESRFVLFRADDEPVLRLDPARYEQAVRVLPPGEPVVRLVEDPAVAELLRAEAYVTPLTIAIPEPDAVPRWGVSVTQMQITFGDRPRAVAGRVFVRLDGREVELGKASLDAGEGQHSYSVGLFVQADNFEAQLPLLGDLAARETIEVVFRTDPDVATNDPRVNEVVNVTLVFRDVPVNLVAHTEDVHAVQSRSTRVPAELNDEDTAP